MIVAQLLALGIVAAPQDWDFAPRPRRDTGWVSLFDGKTLKGWKQINGTATYAVEDGAIVGRTATGSPNSFLCTERMYGDFDLEFEVNIDSRVNSGLQFRSKSVPGYQNGRVHGYQAEIDPTGRMWSGGLYEEGRRGWLADLSKDERARNAFKNEQWNRYRVLADGDRIRIWVNGVPTVDHRDGLTHWGFLGLQVHAHEQTGLPVRYRNLRIKELGPKRGTPSTEADILPASEPPKGGKWLLRNPGDESNWSSERQRGGPAPWKWIDGAYQSGGGDVVTREPLGDCRLHLEFMTDDNGLEGQANGNSGVYLMQSYEVQVLNSAPRGPLDNECGAIYGIKAPDYAMAFLAGQWQSYDIEFRAPRWEGDKKVEDARMTVYHNGTRVHDNVVVPRSTGSGVPESPGLRPIRLQDHGNKVRYRNIWVAPL